MAEVEKTERYLRTRDRLARAFKRILQRPKNRAAVSFESLLSVEADLKRITDHAVKLKWIRGEENGPSPNKKTE